MNAPASYPVEHLETQENYPALQVLVGVIRVLGWAVLVFGVGAGILMAIVRIQDGDAMQGALVGLGVSVGSALLAVTYLASAELVEVAIAAERNTRRTYQLLEAVHEALTVRSE